MTTQKKLDSFLISSRTGYCLFGGTDESAMKAAKREAERRPGQKVEVFKLFAVAESKVQEAGITVVGGGQ